MKADITKNARIIFFVFIIILSAAVISGVTMTVLVIFDILPETKYPALVWTAAMLVVCLLLGMALSALLTRWFFKPVNKLIEATHAVTRGDFTVRIDKQGAKSELSDLIESYNKMADELGGIELFRRDFVNSFSHEFKTPMASIRGFARQLKKAELTDAERNEYADIIISECERLTHMSSNILMLSRFENQQIVTEAEDFHLDEQIRDSILLLEKEWMKKDITLDIDLSPIVYHTNQEMLSQVWLNLIGNAIKFSSRRGTVRIACYEEQRSVRIEVEDHGIGMDSVVLSHIFEQFYQGQGSRTTEGNGLGLTITKRILTLLRGEINVESAPGQGTLVIVTLPK